MFRKNKTNLVILILLNIVLIIEISALVFGRDLNEKQRNSFISTPRRMGVVSTSDETVSIKMSESNRVFRKKFVILMYLVSTSKGNDLIDVDENNKDSLITKISHLTYNTTPQTMRLISNLDVKESMEKNENNRKEKENGYNIIGISLILLFICISLVSFATYFMHKFRKINSEIEQICMNHLENRGLIQTEGHINASNNSVIMSDMYQIIKINRFDIEIRSEIGQGHFGTVNYAILSTLNGKVKTRVAIKNLGIAPDQDYIREASIMKNLDHPNVLNLIGVSVEENGLSLVVLPLMENGDLHSYLIDPTNDPSIKLMLKFGIDIAKGMEYLSMKNLVHRDLAARNCMLDNKLCVKVADFGLARNLYNRNYYKTDLNRSQALPFRWMSIESIEKGIYNTKSDVWSYGVVMWEVFTRGVTPYTQLLFNEILGHLKSGQRLLKPDQCPPIIYDILCMCWLIEPSNRPRFAVLAERLEAIIFDIEQTSINHLEILSFIQGEVQNNISNNTAIMNEMDDIIMINRKDIELHKEIGRGHFGIVYYAILSAMNGRVKIPVAAKRMRFFDQDYIREASIMKNLEHPNILNLIGVSVDDNEYSLIVLPFMENGDLRSYLINPQYKPTIKQIIKFVIDIARGMEYLSKRKFFHRDLAARNCMLDNKLCVKVADFGLSRNNYQILPIRWMSIESIEKGIYNTNTDIWSYGVLMWEVITRGVTPYTQLNNKDVLAYIKSGQRLVKPEYCPKIIYDMMCLCWSIEPTNRPGFAFLAERMEAIITDPESFLQFDDQYYNQSMKR